jgi:hypothetical protein
MLEILRIGNRSSVLAIFGIYPKIHHVNVDFVSRSLVAGTKRLQTNQPRHGPRVGVQNSCLDLSHCSISMSTGSIFAG